MRRIYWLYLVMFLVLTACGGGGGGGSAAFFPSGTDPQPFTFGTMPNVTLDSDIQSADITPTGYTYQAPIKIINGVYSTDGGATWSDTGTGYTGMISPGSRIRVKQRSAATVSTTTVTYLSIGNTVGTFTTITKSNAAPVANVNVLPKQSGANPGTQITLDGSVSTGAAPLTYAWTPLVVPQGSTTAVLSSTTAASPTFTPDVPGTYTTTLTVTDKNGLSSTARQVDVTINALAQLNTTSGIVSVYRADASAGTPAGTNAQQFTVALQINNSGNAVPSVSMKLGNNGKSGTAPQFCSDQTCTTKSSTASIQISNVNGGTNSYPTSSLFMTSTDFSNIDPNGWVVTGLTTP